MPAYADEVFGSAAPTVRFSDPDEAAKLAAASEYGLSLGILTSDVMRGVDPGGSWSFPNVGAVTCL